jgi:hypothetical protein
MEDLLRDVARGDLASMQARIGADRSLLNARGGYLTRTTALACATDHGHLHIARYLLGEGAQVNEGDGTGSPALRVACMRGNHQAMVELLLEAGADAVTPDADGDTPLMEAAHRGHVGIIRALLAHGCGDIDALDDDGWTALYWACCMGHTDAALVLLEAGADMSIASTKGRTPLAVARRERREGCVAVLEVSSAHTWVGWHANRNHPLRRLPDRMCESLIKMRFVIVIHASSSCSTNRPTSPQPPGQGPAPPRRHPQAVACRRWSGCRAIVSCEAGAPGVPGTEGGGGGGGGGAA